MRFTSQKTRIFTQLIIQFFFCITLFFLIDSALVDCAFAKKNIQSVKEKYRVNNAIVKIYTVVNKPDYYRPWQHNVFRNSGSGCVIKGQIILTNAHVVADKAFIEVYKFGDTQRYKAHVAYVSHEADLALVAVDDKSFFEGIISLEIGGLPETQQEVLVYGFPAGGETISITKGIVSRIEHNIYVHSSLYFLSGQIDAAINPGNSGGPVIANGKIVGVVMQILREANNIGYLIPTPVIEHFLTDIQDGQYDGFPEIGIVTQHLENPDLKEMYGMAKEDTGILISHVLPESPAKDILQDGDILLKIDGHQIFNDATIEFRPRERTNYGHFVDMHQIGENVSFDIFRKQKREKVRVKLTTTAAKHYLVQMEQYDTDARFFIFGGFVFTPLTKNLLSAWGKDWQNKAPIDLVTKLSSWPTKEQTEVVLILWVMASSINKGYHGISSWVVDKVNGQNYKDFNHFYQLITQSEDKYLVLENKKKFKIVVNRQNAIKNHNSLLKTYQVPKDKYLGLGFGQK